MWFTWFGPIKSRIPLVKKKEIATEQVIGWIHDHEKHRHMGNGETDRSPRREQRGTLGEACDRRVSQRHPRQPQVLIRRWQTHTYSIWQSGHHWGCLNRNGTILLREGFKQLSSSKSVGTEIPALMYLIQRCTETLRWALIQGALTKITSWSIQIEPEVMLHGRLYLFVEMVPAYGAQGRKHRRLFLLQFPIHEIALPPTAVTENGKRVIRPSITYSVAMFSSFCLQITEILLITRQVANTSDGCFYKTYTLF